MPRASLPLLFLSAALSAGPSYPWLKGAPVLPSIEQRFAPPAGYARKLLPENSFAAWLRALPLKPGRPLVKLHDGVWKFNQAAHAAVIDIDAFKGDLQQCADAVMRLRSEYLFSTGQAAKIHFNIGDKPSHFNEHSHGDLSYARLTKYFRHIFANAGSASLSAELKKVADTGNIEAGDVIIKGGYPGHAVLVVDVAENAMGEKMFLLAQSYMPAQDIHLLRNGQDPKLSPWYKAPFKWPLITPEWVFKEGSHKRFP